MRMIAFKKKAILFRFANEVSDRSAGSAANRICMTSVSEVPARSCAGLPRSRVLLGNVFLMGVVTCMVNPSIEGSNNVRVL